MKKLTSILLALVMLLTLAACGGESAGSHLVTIYILDTVTAYSGDGSESYLRTYVYEEGWQEKEHFSVTINADEDSLGGTITYSGKKTTTEMSDGSVTEQFFDDQGRVTQSINNYADGIRREVTYTYDDIGRVISIETKTYVEADAEPATDTETYVYTETETGSTGTTEYGSITYLSQSITYANQYDKEGRRVSNAMYINGQERFRTEYAYDDAGNMLGQVSFFDGQKSTEVKYTYKAVQVSEATAARFPQFKKAN